MEPSIQGSTKVGHTPNTIDLRPLRNSESDNPMGKDYNYREAFKKLNV